MHRFLIDPRELAATTADFEDILAKASRRGPQARHRHIAIERFTEWLQRKAWRQIDQAARIVVRYEPQSDRLLVVPDKCRGDAASLLVAAYTEGLPLRVYATKGKWANYRKFARNAR